MFKKIQIGINIKATYEEYLIQYSVHFGIVFLPVTSCRLMKKHCNTYYA